MKKYNFFKKIYYSITSKSFYSDVMLEPFKKSICYLILFALLISIPSTIYTAYNIKMDFDKNIDFLNSDSFPSFILDKDGLELDQNEPFVKSFENIVIVIIDDTDTYTLNDLAGYQFGYLFSSERLIITQNAGTPITFEYNQLPDMLLSNQDLIDYINTLKPFIIIGSIIFSLLSAFFTALIYSVFSSIFANIIKNINAIKITYEQAYKIAIYSCTLPLILIQILKFIPIRIAWISIIVFYAVNVIYISNILKFIKSNQNTDS